jgi:alanyl-tRNA synthetase
VKWELGRANVAVDFQKDSEFTATELKTIEDAMNSHIRTGRRISASVTDRDSLNSLSLLRGAPKGVAAEFDQLRIISIDGYDSNPCGGTHLATTSEIQMFKLLNQEKDRGAIRLRFLCGNRILRALGTSLLAEMELSRLLCIQTSEIVPTVTSLFAEKKELVKQVKGLQDELAGYYAQELVQLWSRQQTSTDAHRSHIIQHRPGATLAFLQLAAEVILQMSEAQSLGIQAIFLSGSEGISSSASVASSSSAASSNKKKKSKGASGAAALPLPPSEFSLVIPPSPQAGAFIFYSTASLVDQLKGDICSLLEGKAGGRPGKLQGQGQALQNIVAIDELLVRTLRGNCGGSCEK